MKEITLFQMTVSKYMHLAYLHTKTVFHSKNETNNKRKSERKQNFYVILSVASLVAANCSYSLGRMWDLMLY